MCGLDVLQVPLGRAALCVQPRLERAVGDGEAGLAARLASVAGASEVVQPRKQTASLSDRGGDEVGERVELAGHGFMPLDAP